MIIAIIALIMLLGFFMLWRRLDASLRGRIRKQLITNLRTLSILALIAFLPASLLVRMPEWFPSWLLPLTILSAWGFITIVYWNHAVVSSSKLRTSIPTDSETQ